jgi:hypothetical protein
VSDAETRARIAEHWTASELGDIDTEHAIYAEDAILDYPQSGERFRGRATIAAQRGAHPAERHFAVRCVRGGGDLWVSECVITYDGVATCSVSIMAFAGGLVVHETQYFAAPFPAPPSRAGTGAAGRNPVDNGRADPEGSDRAAGRDLGRRGRDGV